MGFRGGVIKQLCQRNQALGGHKDRLLYSNVSGPRLNPRPAFSVRFTSATFDLRTSTLFALRCDVVLDVVLIAADSLNSQFFASASVADFSGGFPGGVSVGLLAG